MTTIAVLFHTTRGRQFKEFYRGIVCRFMTSEFPHRLSYTRLVALMPPYVVVLEALFETLKDAAQSVYLKAAFAASHKTYGSGRLRTVMAKRGLAIATHRVRTLMRLNRVNCP